MEVHETLAVLDEAAVLDGVAPNDRVAVDDVVMDGVFDELNVSADVLLPVPVGVDDGVRDVLFVRVEVFDCVGV